MKNTKCLSYTLCVVFVVTCFQVSGLGQSTADRNQVANMAAFGSSVRWDVSAQNSGTILTVAAPDGRVFRKEFKAGTAPDFSIVDKSGGRLPDGQYTYELRLNPVSSPGIKDALAQGRKDDEPEDVRATRKRAELPALVQSGSFAILNGSLVNPGAVEAGSRPVSKVTEQPRPQATIAGTTVTKSAQHHPLLIAMPDQVIPDDLIVQGSACVGLDCVNNETFGFDTIRLKENNDRLQFDDTSTAAGFPTNNWQIRANDSASGGASFLGFVDQGATGNSTDGTLVLSVRAGAPANSVLVDSSGRLGLRTATPVLDIHTTTGNTPALRFEQNGSGGFTAQTWDIAGNEANFFIRDVTGGSRLPFRIRPGAPTSSIDIANTGNVNIGTSGGAGLSYRLRVQGAPASTLHTLMTTNDYNGSVGSGLAFETGAASGNTSFRIYAFQTGGSANADLALQPTGGRIGIGTTTPDQLLSVNGQASKAGGGSWAVFSDERLKQMKGRFNSGLKAVMQLQPIRYEYLQNNALGIKSEGEHVGFGAQALQKIIPEAVTTNDRGYLLVNNDPIIWTMLNAIKEQQKEIEQLKGQVRQLRATSRRRR